MTDVVFKVEKNITKTYNLPKMDILKVGHHGFNTSKSFIDVISPKCSIILVG